MVDAVERPIEREYRWHVSDNLRWRRFTHRPGDIFVCTPPKCGTTWMQTIVRSLLFCDEPAPGSVWELSPWIDARFEPIDDVIARLDAQTGRRSIKTHTPADGIPWFPTASYIVVGRDGRDACMSFLNHLANMRPDRVMELVNSAVAEGIELSGPPPPVDDVHAFFRWFLDDNTLWFDHVASFWGHRTEPNVLFVHYGDMKDDLEAEMRRVAAFLELDVPDDRWPDLVKSCTFEGMKARSEEIADFDAIFVGGAETFLYRGTNGRWRDVLTPEELAAFDRRLRERLTPDAVDWTLTGSAD